MGFFWYFLIYHKSFGNSWGNVCIPCLLLIYHTSLDLWRKEILVKHKKSQNIMTMIAVATFTKNFYIFGWQTKNFPKFISNKSLTVYQFSYEHIQEFIEYKALNLGKILFFTLHGGFPQITSFIGMIQICVFFLCLQRS